MDPDQHGVVQAPQPEDSHDEERFVPFVVEVEGSTWERMVSQVAQRGRARGTIVLHLNQPEKHTHYGSPHYSKVMFPDSGYGLNSR